MENNTQSSSLLPQNKDKMLIHAAQHTTNNNSNNNNSINSRSPKISTKSSQNVVNPAIMTPKTNIPSNSPINVPNNTSKTAKTEKTDNLTTVSSKSVLQAPIFTNSSIKDSYTIEPSVLARGRFARVKLCTPKAHQNPAHQNPTDENQKYCVKIVSKRKSGKDLTEDLHHEISILQLAKRQNNQIFIAEIIQVFEEFSQMFLVLKYYQGGELWDHLPDKLNFRPETHKISTYKRIMLEITTGLAWLHSKSIVHLDIKPQNIFLDQVEFEKSHPVIGDFGLSRVLESRNSESGSFEGFRTLVGTPDFCSPEVLKYQVLTLKSDIFSLGVTFYIMCTGESPFYDETPSQIMTNVQMASEDYEFEVFEENSELKQLISEMLKKEPVGRPRASEVMAELEKQAGKIENLEIQENGNNEKHADNENDESSSISDHSELIENELIENTLINKHDDDDDDNLIENLSERLNSPTSSSSDKENKLEISCCLPVNTLLAKSRRESLAVKRPADTKLKSPLAKK